MWRARWFRDFVQRQQNQHNNNNTQQQVGGFRVPNGNQNGGDNMDAHVGRCSHLVCEHPTTRHTARHTNHGGKLSTCLRPVPLQQKNKPMKTHTNNASNNTTGKPSPIIYLPTANQPHTLRQCHRAATLLAAVLRRASRGVQARQVLLMVVQIGQREPAGNFLY